MAATASRWRAATAFEQEDLARSLRLIADGGAEVFYRGRACQGDRRGDARGAGFLALADLAADRAEWRKPITLRYRDVDVVTASPPANAFDYLVRLGIMSRFDNRASGHNSVEYLHRFAEATKHGFWVRLRYAGDPDVAPPPLARLLSHGVLARTGGRHRSGESEAVRAARTAMPPSREPEGSATRARAHHALRRGRPLGQRRLGDADAGRRIRERGSCRAGRASG